MFLLLRRSNPLCACELVSSLRGLCLTADRTSAEAPGEIVSRLRRGGRRSCSPDCITTKDTKGTQRVCPTARRYVDVKCALKLKLAMLAVLYGLNPCPPANAC